MLKPTQILQGRYQLRQQLANNAGRQTWLAQDLNSSPPEPVIVKLLAFSPQMQWDEFKLFEREAAVLKQLNHPQIPNYRDYFSLDKETGAGLYWFGLVQEYIPGKSLQQLLDQGYHFSETQVRSIATQVLKILQYLHGLKPPVLHRDIKPNNLILGRDKRVYLVDFGAVQNSAAVEGVTFTVVGTSGYAPLEQFWGQAVAASDLYALGASLIHLLTGISPADLPQRELRIQFRDKVSINSQFLNWIEALSEPDLELRFQTAFQALNALKDNSFIRICQDKIKHLDIIKRPSDTKIKINKSANKISIYIPSKQIFNQKYMIAFSRKFMPIVGWLLLLIPLSLAMGFIEFCIFLRILEVGSEFMLTYNRELIAAIFGLSLTNILIIPFLYFRSSKYILSAVKSIFQDIQSINKIGDEYLIECDRYRMVFYHQYVSKYNNCYSSKKNALKSTIKEIGIDALENQIYIKVKCGNIPTYNLTINCLNINECKWIQKTLETWWLN